MDDKLLVTMPRIRMTYRKMRASLASVMLAILLASVAHQARGADLYLIDEREIYLILDKLNAMGRLPGFLANTRPYNLKAVRAAIEKASRNAAGELQFNDEYDSWIAYYAQLASIARGTAVLSHSGQETVVPNSGGIAIPKAFSGEFSVLGRYEPFSWLSGNAKGYSVLGEDGASTARLAESSIEIGHKYASAQAGRITTWYGPGRHGDLIFTNNAQSYPGFRLHNPVPIPVSGFFSFLGSVQYDLFCARLDEDRPIPRSIVSGMRVAARPNRFLEVGFSRAFHYGGKGHSDGLSAWWDAFKGTNDNQIGYSGNQIAGYDVEATFPFRVQPVQLYLEMAGEDEATILGTGIPAPTKWAYLGGVFLPAILGNPSLDFRFEIATNHVADHGPVWYVHPYYPHSYRGQILGHPMGTDASDVWVEGHYFFLPSTCLELSFDRAKRYSVGPQTQITRRFSASFVGWLTKSIRVESGIGYESVDNAGGIAASTRHSTLFRVGLSYQIGRE